MLITNYKIAFARIWRHNIEFIGWAYAEYYGLMFKGEVKIEGGE